MKYNFKFCYKCIYFILIIITFIVATTNISAQRRGGGSVHVRAYVRKNGTYVAQHYRSHPDGRFSNNWSTFGNINPYTGKEGKKLSKPINKGTSSIHLSPKVILHQPIPRYKNSSISGLHSTITHSYSTHDDIANDFEMRIHSAENLKRQGFKVDYHTHSYLELSDIESRISKSKDLSHLGVNVDWKEHSWLVMSDWEMRVLKARDLKYLGLEVNWQKCSWLEMSDWEMRILKAKDLKSHGITLDWRRHTWLEMCNIELGMMKP